jgi:hypothetical protein
MHFYLCLENKKNDRTGEGISMLDCISFMNLNMIVSLVLFVISVSIPFFVIMFSDKHYSFVQNAELFLKYALFFNVGCLFITGFAGQLLYGLEISSCIGWSWSPFQYELAFSELALAVLGFLSPIFYREFWLSTIIGSTVWLLGASGVHIYSIYAGNTEILNAAFTIGWNIFIAVWLVGLYFLLRGHRRQNLYEI